jgi:hypothetical protein
LRKLVVFLLLLSSCSGAVEDGPALTFADFTNPSTSAAVPDGAQPTTAPVTTPPPAPPTTTTSTSTTIPVGEAPASLLLVDTAGASLWLQQQGVLALVDEPLETIFDDQQGGFVLQPAGAGVDPLADQRIYWSRSNNKDAQPFLDVGDGALLRLWGVAAISGRPHMLITTTDGPSSGTAGVVRLLAHDFAGGLRELGVVGNEGQAPISITVGGGRILLEKREGANSFFEFRNDDGEVLELEYNPLPECVDDSRCPRLPSLAPGGGLIAFLQDSFDESGAVTTDAVVYDADLGLEMERIALPDPAVVGLAFDGTTIIANRGQELSALMVDLASGVVSELARPGVAHFLVTPPGFDGTFRLVRT